MAESLDDGEFWLPPQFLADDDLFLGKKSAGSAAFAPLKRSSVDAFASQAAKFGQDLFPLEFPYGFDGCSGGVSSDLCSPVDSLGGSAEHSDEEDSLACMMAGCSIVDGGLKGTEHAKSWTVSSSPQSTLCGVGSGCGCGKLRSHGSPNQCSKVASQPATWDLLQAVAGEVAGMRIDDEGCILNSRHRGILGPAANLKNSNPDFGFLQQQSTAYQKLQAIHFQQLRQQQMMKQQGTAAWGVQAKSAAAVYSQQSQAHQAIQGRGRNIGRPTGVWPPVQQPQRRQGGAPMHAVFLPERGAKRECAGTGVFLPRQIGTPAATEAKKKSAGATVLLPAKVVQALKLDEGGQISQFHHLNGNFHPGGDNAARLFNCNIQKRNNRTQAEFNNTQVRLPQEWTY